MITSDHHFILFINGSQGDPICEGDSVVSGGVLLLLHQTGQQGVEEGGEAVRGSRIAPGVGTRVQAHVLPAQLTEEQAAGRNDRSGRDGGSGDVTASTALSVARNG